MGANFDGDCGHDRDGQSCAGQRVEGDSTLHRLTTCQGPARSSIGTQREQLRLPSPQPRCSSSIACAHSLRRMSTSQLLCGKQTELEQRSEDSRRLRVLGKSDTTVAEPWTVFPLHLLACRIGTGSSPGHRWRRRTWLECSLGSFPERGAKCTPIMYARGNYLCTYVPVLGFH